MPTEDERIGRLLNAQTNPVALFDEVVARGIIAPHGSGSREESHLPAPTDPYVNLSIHTALVVLVTSRLREPIASARTCGDT
jgi:hypothetical protein